MDDSLVLFLYPLNSLLKDDISNTFTLLNKLKRLSFYLIDKNSTCTFLDLRLFLIQMHKCNDKFVHGIKL